MEPDEVLMVLVTVLHRDMLVLGKSYTILQKGLEHPQI